MFYIKTIKFGNAKNYEWTVTPMRTVTPSEGTVQRIVF